ncbi:hypothetical protein V5N11_020001 [Cardamine amara subsp. amara]|uniref:Retrotransposon gag domain-containing protein n=1 Tax=Cardamine amara subsp. amara TaxID=228776 RepID=A0ABD0ZJR5_CARAN
MTLPTIEESTSSGSTQASDMSPTTKRAIDELFERIRGVELGQTNLITTVAEMKSDMSRLITAAVAQAFRTPEPSPQPNRNQYQDREYDRYRNTEKQQIDGEGTSREPQNYTEQMPTNQPPPLELTRKLEVPVFSGDSTFAWLSKVERFFRLDNYTDENKRNLVAVSLEGAAIGWFNGEINTEPFTNWTNFKVRLLLRFAEISSRGPTQTLCAIKQMGSAKEYVAHFEDLAGQITSLDASTLEGIFLNRLKGALRSTVEMMKPNNLAEMKAYALSLDAKHLTKLLAKEMNRESQTMRKQRSYTPTNFRAREFSKPQSNTDNTTPQTQNQTRYINDKDMEERKRLGLCFKCDSKWTRDHYKVCTKRA